MNTISAAAHFGLSDAHTLGRCAYACQACESVFGEEGANNDRGLWR